MMKPVYKIFALILALAIFIPAQSFSKVSSDEIKKRIEDWQKTQDFNFGGSYSLVSFDEEAFETIFDKENYSLVRFFSGWYPVENLSLDSSIGGMYDAGKAVGEITGGRSGEVVELYILPVQFSIRYRFKFLEDQFIVPSIWGGGDYWLFNELNEEEDDVEGDKWGWRYGADIGFLLDPIDTSAASAIKRNYGIDDTYFVIGYEKQSIGEEENGLSFTGENYSVGIRFDIAGEKK
jgi:hypothetical protein